MSNGRELLAASSRKLKSTDGDDAELQESSRPGRELVPGKTRASTRLRIDRKAYVEPADVSEDRAGYAFELARDASVGIELPTELSEKFAREFGVDVSRVRIHNDAAAARAAATLNAQAFTIGNDIYFAHGQYDPTSDRGVHLIAHEMAHVADNQRGAVSTVDRVSRPDDPHEQRADALADRFKADASTHLETSDPAELVEHVRREGHRRELPFISELENHFGTSLDFVETYTGEAAELACRLMAAGAFAVRNIVALADASPQRDTLMHELTHVIQSGGRAARAPARFERGSLSIGAHESAVEHEASAHAARPTQLADSNTVHRKNPATPDTADSADTIKARVEKFAKKKAATIIGPVKKEELKFVATVQNAKGFDERYYEATEAFSAASYGTDATGNKSTDLNTVLKSDGEALRLHKIDGAGSNYIITKPGTAYSQTAKKVKPVGTWPDYFDNIKKIETSSKKTIDFKWPDASKAYDKDEPALTADENKEYRGAMRTAIAKAFKDGDGKFDELYTHVVKPQYFSQRICGDIFEECVKESADDDMVASTDQPIFDKKSFSGIGNKKRVMGDGTIDMEVDGEAIHAIVECKAYNESGPSSDVKSQMKVYKKLLGKKGYKIGGVVQQIPFNHIAYYVTTSDDPDKKKALLAKWHKALQDAGFAEGEYSLVPPPEGVEFKIKYNPEFAWPIPKGQTSVHLHNPAVNHPGLKIGQISASLDDNLNVKSGTIVYSVDAADLKKTDVSKPITPAKDGSIGGQVDNKLTGLTSKLSQYLPLEVDAAIVDQGVEATLKLKKGATKGLAGFEIDAAELKALYSGAGTLAVDGTVGLKHKNGKIGGSVTIGYDNGWSFVGTIDVAAGVIPGFPAFKASVSKSATGEWKVTVDEDISFEKKFGAITLSGTASDLSYNFTTGKFGGEAVLDADLGMFGKASGSAKIKDNELSKASLSYDTPEFKYPAKSEKPAFAGTVGGTVKYDEGKWSGDIRGKANIVMPALQKIAGEKGIALDVDGHIAENGAFSGTVKSTNPLKFGKYLEVPKLSCSIDKDGALSGDFAIKVVNIKHLESASIECTVTKSGISVKSAGVKVTFGNEEKGKFWGSLSVGYTDDKGLDIGGSINYKIKDDMVATGTLKYEQGSNAVTLEMKVSEITLVDKKMSKTLFKASKQIPVVNVYGLGIYVDIGFDLGFDFGFKLTMTPEVDFVGLSLDTWQFEKIAAKLKIGGDVFAQLTGIPKLGIGVFALDPSIIRGGGGLKVPIVGRLDIKPSGDFGVAYKNDGSVDGTAKLGLAGQFGITGSLKPYAEFSVLNDMWNPTWEGEALASFEILKPKELFNFTVDFAGDNKDLKDGPQLPEENSAKAPSEPTGDRTAKAEPGTAEDKGGGANKEQAAKEGEVAENGDSGPFSLDGLLEKFKGNKTVATATKIFNYAKKVWKVIKPIYDIVEPIVELIGKRIEAIIDLFDTEAPTGDNLGPWLWKLAGKLWNVAFGGLSDIANAISTIFGAAVAFAKKFITKAVKDGQIGVKRHSYYIWKPWPMDNYEFMAAAEYKVQIPGVVNLGHHEAPGFLLSPSGAVSLVLYEALEGVGMAYSYVGNSDINRPYNDFWYGAGARG